MVMGDEKQAAENRDVGNAAWMARNELVKKAGEAIFLESGAEAKATSQELANAKAKVDVQMARLKIFADSKKTAEDAQKALEEEAKAWGVYADIQIASLEKLNQYKNEATKIEFERQKWAQEKIIEGETEFNQTRIDAWAAVYSVQAEEDQEWIKMHEYAQQKILEGEQQAAQDVIDAWAAVYEVTTAKALEDQKKLDSIWQEFGSSLSSAWATNVTDMLKGTKTLAEGMKSLFQGIADVVISSITKMIANWILWGNITGYAKGETMGGIIGGIGSIFGLKEGGIIPGWKPISTFQEGGIIPEWKPIHAFQEGGLINRPTFGMIGEGGPEAVIPLKGGKIPVETKGGGDTYVYITANDAKSFYDMILRNPEGILKVIHRDARAAGPMRTVIRGA